MCGMKDIGKAKNQSLLAMGSHMNQLIFSFRKNVLGRIVDR